MIARQSQVASITGKMLIGFFVVALALAGVRLSLCGWSSSPSDVIRTKSIACCTYSDIVLIGDLPDYANVVAFNRLFENSDGCVIRPTREMFEAQVVWDRTERSIAADLRWFGTLSLSLPQPLSPNRSIFFAKRASGFLLCIPLVMLASVQCIQMAMRRRIARKGRCLSCGYDLTGNTSGRCPECGRIVKRAA